jgi:hypothetical protein
MSTGLAYGLTGLLGLALGLTNARKQAQEDALLESKLGGPGEWTPVPDVDRSLVAKLLSAGLPQDVIEVSPGHTYRFTPYGKTTPEDISSLGLTTPVQHAVTTPPPGGGFGPPLSPWVPPAPAQAAGFQPTTTTRQEPVKAYVGQPKGPELMQALMKERAQRHDQSARQAETDRQAMLRNQMTSLTTLTTGLLQRAIAGTRPAAMPASSPPQRPPRPFRSSGASCLPQAPRSLPRARLTPLVGGRCHVARIPSSVPSLPTRRSTMLFMTIPVGSTMGGWPMASALMTPSWSKT